MSNNTKEYPITGISAPRLRPQSASMPELKLVQSSQKIRRLANVVFVGLVLAILGVLFLPWQQTAKGTGRVIAFVPQERQQTVTSPIKGIVATVAPGLREGDWVKQDQIILELQPAAANLGDQLESQIRDLEGKQAAIDIKIQVYGQNVLDFGEARDFAVRAAQEMVDSAIAKRDAKLRLVPAYEAKELQARLNLERQEQLSQQGATSQREVEILKRDREVALSELEAARLDVKAAEFEVAAKQHELEQKRNEANTKVDNARAYEQSAISEKASVQKEIRDLKIKRSELEQLVIRAPRDGTIFRLPVFERGQTVKEGEALFTIVPETQQLAVEIWVDGNDVSLILIGDHVRLQFEGWPAIQFAGWPSVAVGTFGGEVVAIDDSDDGMGKFRVQVRPLTSNDSTLAWPDASLLRQGVRANGWVMLRRVSLGFEIWRQLNGFPPTRSDSSPAMEKSPAPQNQSRLVQGPPRMAQTKQLMICGGLCLLIGMSGCRAARLPTPWQQDVKTTGAVVETSVAARPSQPSHLVRPSKPLPVTLKPGQVDIAVSTSSSPDQLPDAPQQVGDSQAPESDNATTPLTLGEVIVSVDAAFPLLFAAYLQQQVAAGNQVAAQGAFDLNLKGSTTAQPVGFYENFRHSLGLQRQLWNSGTSVYGGYRLGAGKFEPWYKERETNEGGELAIGATIPLSKNRLIDAQRTELQKAEQDLAAFDPFIQSQRNQFLRDAAIAYWGWVEAGKQLQIQRRLLRLAEDRAKQIEARVARGDIPELAGIDNQRLIAQRETKLIDATRKFQAAAIKLSIFLRDFEGQPMLADEVFVPAELPPVTNTEFQAIAVDVQQAIEQHPEIQQLDFEINKAQLDVQLAENSVLGKLDLFVESSQDIGGRASSLGDKSPLEIEAGLLGELPLQRRAGLGKVTASQAKLQQWQFKRQFLGDKIANAVRDSYSAYLTARERLDRAARNLDLARRALEIGKQQFTAGSIDLIILNIYEQSVTDAEVLVVEAQIAIEQARVEFQFARGTFEPVPGN